MKNFFEHQERARKRTGLLVACLLFAVTGIVFSLYAIATYAISNGQLQWNSELFAFVTAATLIVVSAGSGYKILQLNSGGKAVAENLGGRLLDTASTDPTERKILNIVEEMAIASGVSIPPVYLLDEEGINAFAAGFHLEDAVIGITRGAIQQLNRDELQGVIAHEFSHILNGDMRLNIQLIGILHGVLLIGLMGYYTLRVAIPSRRSSRNNSKGVNPVLVIALGLIVVGFIGTFFGNLIKAAVSRQREFLADASAVQFTRNPASIGGALKKIGGWRPGSKIQAPAATEVSHLFFGQAVRGLFATHPPLEERIRRIDPSWDGNYIANSGTAQMGQPSQAHIQHAQQLIGAMPTQLKEAAREGFSARALVYALLLSSDSSLRKSQLEGLSLSADQGVFAATKELLPQVDRSDRNQKIPLLEMALGPLQQLSDVEFSRFCRNIAQLINSDGKLSTFEWALQRILYHRFMVPRPTATARIETMERGCELLLSRLAHAGGKELELAEQGMREAKALLGMDSLSLLPREQCHFDALNEALDQLTTIRPAGKKKLLEACAHCISIDQKVAPEEAELFRAIGEALNCPIPPLLPCQSLA